MGGSCLWEGHPDEVRCKSQRLPWCGNWESFSEEGGQCCREFPRHPALSTPEMTVGQQESGLRTGRCRSCNPAEVLRQYELISKDPSLNRCPKLGPPTGFVGLGGHSRKTVPGQSGAACADPRAVFLCFCYADVFSETLLIYCFHCLWYLSFSF